MATLEKFFALSTCIHCRHTKELLEEHKVPFTPIYVDLLEGAERERVVEDQSRYNPDLTFPTLVFSDGKVITGFQRDKIKEELGL